MNGQNLTARATWRKSSFSGSGASGSGDCVEVATLADGTIGVRDSKHPDAAALRFTRSEMAEWISACKAGEFA
jgi:hypothetical protein